MKLQELMVKDVIQAAPEETVGVAGKRMRDQGSQPHGSRHFAV